MNAQSCQRAYDKPLDIITTFPFRTHRFKGQCQLAGILVFLTQIAISGIIRCFARTHFRVIHIAGYRDIGDLGFGYLRALVVGTFCKNLSTEACQQAQRGGDEEGGFDVLFHRFLSLECWS